MPRPVRFLLLPFGRLFSALAILERAPDQNSSRSNQPRPVISRQASPIPVRSYQKRSMSRENRHSLLKERVLVCVEPRKNPATRKARIDRIIRRHAWEPERQIQSDKPIKSHKYSRLIRRGCNRTLHEQNSRCRMDMDYSEATTLVYREVSKVLKPSVSTKD
jgi:hypothetical protein